MNSERVSEMWEKIQSDKTLIANAVAISERDVKTARKMYEDSDFDWCFSVSYNAMLQSGRALMFSKGFRPKGEFKHVAVIEFVRVYFKDNLSEKVIFMFNKMRKKRHSAVYEQVNLISMDEAENALHTAEGFLKSVKNILDKS